jgi:hypothetical protein
VRAGRGAHWNLVQARTDTRIDIQGFKKPDVEATRRIYGWHLPT